MTRAGVQVCRQATFGSPSERSAAIPLSRSPRYKALTLGPGPSSFRRRLSTSRQGATERMAHLNSRTTIITLVADRY